MNGGSTSFGQSFVENLQSILFDGGILMIPLSILSLTIYSMAFAMFGYFVVHRFYRTGRDRIEYLVNHPQEAHGEIAEIMDYANRPEVESVDDIATRFVEIRNVYLGDIDARRSLMLKLVTAAPLLGLLGTVMGMLTTFSGLALSTAGRTVDQIAEGISVALITTQTGLIIAIPGYVIAGSILKRRNQMESCLTALENHLVQRFRREHAGKSLPSHP